MQINCQKPKQTGRSKTCKSINVPKQASQWRKTSVGLSPNGHLYLLSTIQVIYNAPDVNCRG